MTSDCGQSGGRFIQLYFVGSAWPLQRRQAVQYELGVELGRRRSLDVCVSSVVWPNAEGVVTLLANGADRVSVVPFRIEEEGAFNGRTIELAPIPEDARPLAIAQAVDEVLLGSDAAAVTRPPAVGRPALVVHEPPRRGSAPVQLTFGVGPALQVAPSASTNADKASLATGLALRLGVVSRRWSTSIGLTLPRASELVFGNVTLEQHRTPLDFSVGWVLTRRPSNFDAVLSGGLVLALLETELTPNGPVLQKVEAGPRLAMTLSYGRQVAAWVAASVELIPVRSEIRFTPLGAVGTTSNLWLGLSAGVAVRWPS